MNSWSSTMTDDWKISGCAVAVLMAAGLLPSGASAISVEVAKKCDILVAKAFPPRQDGNPAAGSAKGSGQAEVDYFNKCVANGGNMNSRPADKAAK
jgi:hypothetical protein